MGFEQTKSDPFLYVKESLFVTVYVEDLVIAGKKEKKIGYVKELTILLFAILT